MNKLSSEQAARLSEIAAYLQQKRLELSVPLEYIEQNTQIRVSLLQALEEGRFEALPEPIYIKGFIRLYGKAVGVDGDFLAQDFAQISQPVPQEQLVSQPATTESNQAAPNNFNVPRQLRLRYAIPYLILLLGATAGLSYLVRQSATEPQPAQIKPELQVVTTPKPTAEAKTQTISQQKVKVKPPSEAEVTPKPQPTTDTPALTTPEKPSVDTPQSIEESTSQPTATPTPSTATAPIPEKQKESEESESTVATATASTTAEPINLTTAPVSVNMKLEKENAWVRVIVDGKTEYEGILTAGEQRTWNGQKEIKIRSGNAGAVILSTNQSPPQAMGAIGQVKDITITPSTPNSASE